MSGQMITQRVWKGWQRLSITNKLFISALGFIIASFVVSAAIITKISSDSLRQAINAGMTSEAQRAALQIDEQLKEGIAALNNVVDNPTIIALMQRSESKAQTKTLPEYRLAVQTLKRVKADNPNFISVYVGIDKTDYIIDEKEWVSPSDYVMKDRDWYKGIVGADGVFITKVYKDEDTGKLVVTIGKAVRDHGKLLGVVAVDYSFGGINEIMKNFKLSKLGYAMLLDQEGLILYHPRSEKILKENLSESSEEETRAIVRKMVGGENGTVYFHYENAAQYLSYAPIPLSHWSVGVVTAEDEYEKPMRTTDGACAVVYLVCIIFIGFAIRYVSKSILRPIPSLLTAMRQAASGDLTTQVRIDSYDEMGQIAAGLNAMITQQKEAVTKVLDLSCTVARASAEINSGNEELSRRTQEQASTLEEVAATVEVVTASLKQTAQNSSEAVKISNWTLETVHEGESAIAETAEAMGRITESSKQIQAIMKVIKDITFQTNLLALNAAVEAARAGEQGRGFAVVAAEVRNLAGRTADSSREIEELIRESVSRVEKGNELVQRSKAVLEEIVRNTQKTAMVVADITTTMGQQSTASGQIQTAIEELNQVTQQNAAMVEEIAASSATLNHETTELEETVSNFKID